MNGSMIMIPLKMKPIHLMNKESNNIYKNTYYHHRHHHYYILMIIHVMVSSGGCCTDITLRERAINENALFVCVEQN